MDCGEVGRAPEKQSLRQGFRGTCLIEGMLLQEPGGSEHIRAEGKEQTAVAQPMD